MTHAGQIKDLLRERDWESMLGRFDLWSCDDVVGHADAILARLRNETKPCDGASSSDQVGVFQRWVETRKQH